MENDQDCGSRLSEPFAFFDPELCSWKTARPSLLEDSLMLSDRWPNSGTYRHGAVFGLPRSELRIGENVSTSLPPTPTASDGKGGPGHQGRDGGENLRTAVEHLLPTLTATDAKGGRNKTAKRSDPDSKHHDGMTLCDAVHMLTENGNQRSEDGKVSPELLHPQLWEDD